jgi:hypothetical protein
VNRSRSAARAAAVSGMLLASTGAVAVLSAPARAMPAPVTTASCIRATGGLAFRGGHADDGMKVSRAKAARLQQAFDQRATQRTADVLPDVVEIPVYLHVIRGTHASDIYLKQPGIDREMAVLNDAYAGGQDATNHATRYSFALAGTTTTVNDTWYHVSADTQAAKTMKRTLHQGDAASLNLYFLKPAASSGLLGFSTFPWDYENAPGQDGVVINIASRPLGEATHYNEGDTTVHEVGHWLGLYHTFSDYGDCSNNDFVPDTPRQKNPTNGCPSVKPDSCPTYAGRDDVHNFMDYSYDSCMFEFTAGQVTRMDQSWTMYRAP